MALSVKVAKTDPMPLKLQVEVLSKKTPEVFKNKKPKASDDPLPSPKYTGRVLE